MDFATLALFFAAALAIAISPGPGIFYVAARTLAGGRSEGLASSFGTDLAGWSMWRPARLVCRRW